MALPAIQLPGTGTGTCQRAKVVCFMRVWGMTFVDDKYVDDHGTYHARNNSTTPTVVRYLLSEWLWRTDQLHSRRFANVYPAPDSRRVNKTSR
jgi:hypothetical protein